jgi:hypothetical protein
LIRNFANKDIAAVLNFLEELIAVCPFAIIEIQTDNDAAFTDKYTSQRGLMPTGMHPVHIWCRKNQIHHRLIPLAQKELNGKVENTHKQDDREHFARIQPKTLRAIAALTCLYNDRWNEHRKTKAPGWKTPNDVIVEAEIRMLTWLLMLKAR